MNIDMQSLGFPITAESADPTRCRLRIVFTRRIDRIQRAVVRFDPPTRTSRAASATSSVEFRCYLIGAPVAAVEDIGSDLGAAIDRAIDRAGRLVIKLCDRTCIDRRDGADAPTLLCLEVDDAFHVQHIGGQRV